MTTKFSPRRFPWSVLITTLLVACGNLSPQSTPTTAPTPVSATLAPSPMPVSPTSTIRPATSIPSASLVPSPPDELRMAYIMDGNLYFQDGSKPPLQLTHSLENWQPMFSDDGEKIIFLHGKDWEEIHSINSDGGQEQVLVTKKLLMTLDTSSYDESTKIHSVTMVPGTHLLLFGTHFSLSNRPIWNNDLLMVDTDTAEIQRLLPPRQVNDFSVSPNGKFIAIDRIGQIDVIDLGGKIVRQNLLTYAPSEPSFLAPGISWRRDSIGLVITLPVPTVYETSASGPSYTVWRYRLDDGQGVQVPLDILPTDVYMATVSPDGNWILYNNNDQYAFYIGDLRAGSTQLYLPSTFVFHYERGWNSDNEHFVYSTAPGSTLFLGSVNGSPELIGKGEFLGWIDTNRYLYYSDKNILMGDINGPKEIILADHEFFQSPSLFTFILP